MKQIVWIRLAKCALSVVLVIGSLEPSSPTARAQPPEDQGQGPALSPQESITKFQVAEGLEWTQLLTEPTVRQPLMTTFDSRGRLWVVQYLQYPEPAGIKALSRDNFWRIVYDQMPKPPGHGGTPGADKITIHEDRDGDGRYEHETTFVDGLNIVSSVVPTEEGAWVLNPPYLLFFRDSNGDSRADGPPEVHLEGFGLEDTHSVVNSLCMGPDGWLYAAQGSTVTAAVRKYGSTDPPVKSLGQALWRYHPRTHEYELFAEGGGNAFGVAFDELGQVFSGYNGGDTRGFHYMQGGYYLKGFTKHGSLSNPFSFGYLKPMKHDPVQRFTHTMLMTDGTSLQSKRSSSMLTVDPLHGKLFHTKLNPIGSTYSTIDEETSVASEDKWFRPVAIQDGPDGAAYVCDWYDFQVAHIYAHVGKMDRDHGRIYRLAPIQSNDEAPAWNSRLARAKDAESLPYLLQTLRHPYRWQRWQARRLIVEHPLRETLRSDLIAILNLDDEHSIDALWTLQQCGWISDTIPSIEAGSTKPGSSSSQLSKENAERQIIDPATLFRSQRPEIRSWTVRLVADDRSVARTTREALQKLAAIESHPQVLCQIACSIRRLPPQEAFPILRSMLNRDLPTDDLFLPLLVWWAAEQHADQGPAVLLTLLEEDSIWQYPLTRSLIAPNLIQRWSRRGTLQEMHWVASLLSRIDVLQGESRLEAGRFANEGFEKAYEGKSLVGVPDSVLDGLSQVGQPSIALRLRRGDAEVVLQANQVLLDRQASAALRAQLAKILGEVPRTSSLPALLELLERTDDQESVRAAAIHALAAYDRDEVADRILNQWSRFPDSLRPIAGAVLASRATWTLRWLDACESKSVAPESLAMEVVRAMRLQTDPAIARRMEPFYPLTGSIDLTTAHQRSTLLSEDILANHGDPYAGKKIFKNVCARCHKLFDQGGEIGPDLTGYQRDQLPGLLVHMIAPSLEIREGFQTVAVALDDGQVLAGFVERADTQVVIRGIDGQSHTLERSEIESMTSQPQSLMPEGLLDPMNPQEIRDLVAYLRSSQPLNDGS